MGVPAQIYQKSIFKIWQSIYLYGQFDENYMFVKIYGTKVRLHPPEKQLLDFTLWHSAWAQANPAAQSKLE